MKAIHKIEALPLKELDSGALVLLLQKYILDQPEHFNPEKIANALNLATYLHRKAVRSFRLHLPGTPYIEHPLRNAIRLLRDGCVSEKVIIGELLHDTIEDCAREIVSEFMGIDPHGKSESEIRTLALVYFGEEFGVEVTLLVNNVSNRILPEGTSKEKKNDDYVGKMKEVLCDPDTFAVKYADFRDNALGLYHNYVHGKDNRKTVARAVKYLRTIPVFEDAYPSVVSRLPMNEVARAAVPNVLQTTRKRLEKIIALG